MVPFASTMERGTHINQIGEPESASHLKLGELFEDKNFDIHVMCGCAYVACLSVHTSCHQRLLCLLVQAPFCVPATVQDTNDRDVFGYDSGSV